MASTKDSLWSDLEAFAQEVRARHVKEAKAKAASTDNLEPEKQTSHPTSKPDENAMNAVEGEQTAKNTSTVKETIPGGGADSASPAGSVSSQEEQQQQIGTNKTTTGKDTATERDYVGEIHDPGTSHPAKANDGEKYAKMSFDELFDLSTKQANNLVASISAKWHNNTQDIKKTKENQQQKAAASAGKVEATPSITKENEEALKQSYDHNIKFAVEHAVREGVQLAYDIHELLSSEEEELKKEAAAAQRKAMIERHKSASKPAKTVKKAEDEEESESSDSGSEESEGDKKKEKNEGESKLGGEESDVVSSDGGSVPPDVGGGDPLAAMGGGGGDVGGGGGGMGGGSPDEAAINEFLTALLEQGITPEQLIQMLTGGGGMGGGMGGGAPPAPAPEAPVDPMAAMGGGEMGGMAGMGMGEPKMAARNDLVELTKMAAVHLSKGKYRPIEAKTAAEVSFRNEIKKVIKDFLPKGK